MRHGRTGAAPPLALAQLEAPDSAPRERVRAGRPDGADGSGAAAGALASENDGVAPQPRRPKGARAALLAWAAGHATCLVRPT